MVFIVSMKWHINLSLGTHLSALGSSAFFFSSWSILDVSTISLVSSSVSGKLSNVCCRISLTCDVKIICEHYQNEKCTQKFFTLSICFCSLIVVSFLCLRCKSNMTRTVSRAWWGRNSFNKWCMCIKSRLMSSTFSARLGESGHWINRSSKSRKLTNNEWLSFRNSRRLSKCWGYRRLKPWNN